jgi:hypothetical protein
VPARCGAGRRRWLPGQVHGRYVAGISEDHGIGMPACPAVSHACAPFGQITRIGVRCGLCDDVGGPAVGMATVSCSCLPRTRGAAWCPGLAPIVIFSRAETGGMLAAAMSSDGKDARRFVPSAEAAAVCAGAGGVRCRSGWLVVRPWWWWFAMGWRGGTPQSEFGAVPERGEASGRRCDRPRPSRRGSGRRPRRCRAAWRVG